LLHCAVAVASRISGLEQADPGGGHSYSAGPRSTPGCRKNLLSCLNSSRGPNRDIGLNYHAKELYHKVGQRSIEQRSVLRSCLDAYLFKFPERCPNTTRSKQSKCCWSYPSESGIFYFMAMPLFERIAAELKYPMVCIRIHRTG
jgi:hypothetical protein